MTMRNALALTINSKRNLACYALSSGFSIPTGVATAITWIAQYDDAGFLSSTKFTVPLTGLYHLDFYLHWVSNATGNRLIEFRKNGTTLMNGSGWPSANSLNDTRHAVSALLQLNAGDYIEVMATQTSGSTIGATSQATFVITKIR